MAATWEYIKRRRGWTCQMIVDGLPEKSWESFCLFFTSRNIEIPDRSEYDACVKKTPEPVLEKPKRTTRKRSSKPKGKNNV